MLEKETFKNGIQELVYAFIDWKIDVKNQEIMKIWYRNLNDYSEDIFLKGVQKYIKTQRYNPTIASLRDVMDEFRNRIEPKGNLKDAAEMYKDWIL